MSGFDISVQWRTAVGQETGDGTYYFPDKLSRRFREKYAVPAVYRWRAVRQAGEKEQIYIGEAEELTRRMLWVLSPYSSARTSDTSKRLNRIFAQLVLEGKKIVLDVADVDPFEINGIRFDKRDLGDRFKRRMLENLLLVEAQASPNFELLNSIVDPLDRDREALNRLTPRQVRETVERYKLRKPESA